VTEQAAFVKPNFSIPKDIWARGVLNRDEVIGQVVSTEVNDEGFVVRMTFAQERFRQMSENILAAIQAESDRMNVELTRRLWLNAWVEEFHPPTRTLSPFERQDVDLELIPIARYDPRIDLVEVPASVRWDLSSVDISWERPVPPAPPLAPINLEYFNTGHYRRQVIIDWPITEQRRRREV
jgi:hypothetical protein